MDITKFEHLQNKKLYIVLDTNVILNLARYSIYTSKLILDKLEEFRDYIWLPYQVLDEYEKHHREVFGGYERKYSRIITKLCETVERNKQDFKKALNPYRRDKYYRLDEFEEDILKKLDEIKVFIDGLKNNQGSESLNETKVFIDQIKSFISDVKKNKQINTKLSTKEYLSTIKEGELRFRYNIAPGYLDSKDKEGKEKFGDLIIWKEILKLPKITDAEAVIFITDDNKGDWGEIQRNGVFTIDSFLEKEFDENNPNCSIDFINSENFLRLFYDDISYSRSFIELNLERDNFIERIENQIVEQIENYIINSDLSLLPNVRPDMVENIEIIESDLLDYTVSYFEDRGDYLLVGYDVTWNVYVEFDSYIYSGRDQDTREVIYDQGSHHEFLCQLELEISRTAYYDADNFSDTDFEILNFHDKSYSEINYEEYAYDENYFEDDNISSNSDYICPDCNSKLTLENDMGGICRNCYK